MATRGDGTSAADVAAAFGVSRSTAYRALKAKPTKETPPSDLRKRLADLRGRKGPLVEVVIDGERFEVTQRAKDALDAAHARLADGWRVVYEDRAVMERGAAETRAAVADFMNRTRVRMAKTNGPYLPVPWSMPGQPLRYSVSVQFGPAAPKNAPTPVALMPWPLPWEPMHPTEAIGQIFRRAMRGQPLPAASAALVLIDKAVESLNAFREMLKPQPDPVSTGPPEPAEPATPEPATTP